MSERPLILVSNDDGFFAPGCVALRTALRDIADVVTVAPASQQSAVSQAISLHRPVRVHEVEPRVFAVDGTPADSVYVGLFHEGILPRRPDLVVSGVNHGPNLGNDVFYSGTVAAAREAAFRGIPSMAFSQIGGGSMERAGGVARGLCERLLRAEQPPGAAVLLNVNIPAGEIRGVRACDLGERRYDEGVVVRQDPRGRDYMWIGGEGGVTHGLREGSDTEAVDQGFVSVTPLRLTMTQPEHFGMASFVSAGHEEES